MYFISKSVDHSLTAEVPKALIKISLLGIDPVHITCQKWAVQKVINIHRTKNIFGKKAY